MDSWEQSFAANQAAWDELERERGWSTRQRQARIARRVHPPVVGPLHPDEAMDRFGTTCPGCGRPALIAAFPESGGFRSYSCVNEHWWRTDQGA